MACKEAHDATKLLLSSSLGNSTVSEFFIKKTADIENLYKLGKTIGEDGNIAKGIVDTIVKREKELGDVAKYSLIGHPSYADGFIKQLKKSSYAERGDFLEFAESFNNNLNKPKQFDDIVKSIFGKNADYNEIVGKIKKVSFANEIISSGFKARDMDKFMEIYGLSGISKSDKNNLYKIISRGDRTALIGFFDKVSPGLLSKSSTYSTIPEIIGDLNAAKSSWDAINIFLRGLSVISDASRGDREDILSLFRKIANERDFKGLSSGNVGNYNLFDNLIGSIEDIYRYNKLPAIKNVDHAIQVAVFWKKLGDKGFHVDSNNKGLTVVKMHTNLRAMYMEFLANGRKMSASRFKEIMDKNPLGLLTEVVEKKGKNVDVRVLNTVEDLKRREEEVLDMLGYDDIINNDDYLKIFMEDKNNSLAKKIKQEYTRQLDEGRKELKSIQEDRIYEEMSNNDDIIAEINAQNKQDIINSSDSLKIEYNLQKQALALEEEEKNLGKKFGKKLKLTSDYKATQKSDFIKKKEKFIEYIGEELGLDANGAVDKYDELISRSLPEKPKRVKKIKNPKIMISPEDIMKMENKALENTKKFASKKVENLGKVKGDKVFDRDVSNQSMQQQLGMEGLSTNKSEIIFFETSRRPVDESLGLRRDEAGGSMPYVALPGGEDIVSYTDKGTKDLVTKIKDGKVKNILVSNYTDEMLLPYDVRKAVSETEDAMILYPKAKQTYNLVKENGVLKVKANSLTDINNYKFGIAGLYGLKEEAINITKKGEEYSNIVNKVLNDEYGKDAGIVKQLFDIKYKDMSKKEIDKALSLISNVSDMKLQEKIINIKREFSQIKKMSKEQYDPLLLSHLQYISDDMGLGIDMTKFKDNISKRNTEKLFMLSKNSPNSTIKYQAREELLKQIGAIKGGLPYTVGQSAELYKKTVNYVESKLGMSLPVFFDFTNIFKWIDKNGDIINKLSAEGVSESEKISILSRIPKNVSEFVTSTIGKNPAIAGIYGNITKTDQVLSRIKGAMITVKDKGLLDTRNLNDLLDGFDKYLKGDINGVGKVVTDFDDSIYDSIKRNIAAQGDINDLSNGHINKRQYGPKGQNKLLKKVDDTLNEFLKVGQEAVDGNKVLTMQDFISLKDSMKKKVDELEAEIISRYNGFVNRRDLMGLKGQVYLLSSSTSTADFTNAIEKMRIQYKGVFDKISAGVKDLVESQGLKGEELLLKNKENLLKKGYYFVVNGKDVVRVTIEDAIENAKLTIPGGLGEDVDNLLNIDYRNFNLENKAKIYKSLESVNYYVQNPNESLLNAIRKSMDPEFHYFSKLKVHSWNAGNTKLPAAKNMIIPNHMDNPHDIQDLANVMGLDDLDAKRLDYYIKGQITNTIFDNLDIGRVMKKGEIEKTVYRTINDTLLNYMDYIGTKNVEAIKDAYIKHLQDGFGVYSSISQVKITEAMKNKYKKGVNIFNKTKNDILNVDILEPTKGGYTKNNINGVRDKTDIQFENIATKDNVGEEDVQKMTPPQVSKLTTRYVDESTDKKMFQESIDGLGKDNIEFHDKMFELKAKQAQLRGNNRTSTIGTLMKSTKKLWEYQKTVGALEEDSVLASSAIHKLLKGSYDDADKFIIELNNAFDKASGRYNVAINNGLKAGDVNSTVYFVGNYFNKVMDLLKDTGNSEFDAIMREIPNSVKDQSVLKVLAKQIEDGNLLSMGFHTREGIKYGKKFVNKADVLTKEFKDFVNKTFVGEGEFVSDNAMELLYDRIRGYGSRRNRKWFATALSKVDSVIRKVKGVGRGSALNLVMQFPGYMFTKLLDHSRSMKKASEVIEGISRGKTLGSTLGSKSWRNYGPIERDLLKAANNKGILEEMQFGLQQATDIFYRQDMKEKAIYEVVRDYGPIGHRDLDSFAKWLKEEPESKAKQELINEIKTQATLRFGDITGFSSFGLDQRSQRGFFQKIATWFDYRGSWGQNITRTLFENTVGPTAYGFGMTYKTLKDAMKHGESAVTDIKKVRGDVFKMYAQNAEIKETFSALFRALLRGNRMSAMFEGQTDEESGIMHKAFALKDLLATFYMPFVGVTTNFLGRQMVSGIKMATGYKSGETVFNDFLREFGKQYKIVSKSLGEVLKQIDNGTYSFSDLIKSYFDATAGYMRYLSDNVQNGGSMDNIPSSGVNRWEGFITGNPGKSKKLYYEGFNKKNQLTVNNLFSLNYKGKDIKVGGKTVEQGRIAGIFDYARGSILMRLPLISDLFKIYKASTRQHFGLTSKEKAKQSGILDNKRINELNKGNLNIMGMIKDIKDNNGNSRVFIDNIFYGIKTRAKTQPGGGNMNKWIDAYLAHNEGAKNNFVLKGFIKTMGGNVSQFASDEGAVLSSANTKKQTMETLVMLESLKDYGYDSLDTLGFGRALLETSFNTYNRINTAKIKALNKARGYGSKISENDINNIKLSWLKEYGPVIEQVDPTFAIGIAMDYMGRVDPNTQSYLYASKRDNSAGIPVSTFMADSSLSRYLLNVNKATQDIAEGKSSGLSYFNPITSLDYVNDNDQIAYMNRFIDQQNKDPNISSLEKSASIANFVVNNPDVVNKLDELDVPDDIKKEAVSKIYGTEKSINSIAEAVGGMMMKENNLSKGQGNSFTLPKGYDSLFKNLTPTLKAFKNLIKANQSKLLQINPVPSNGKRTDIGLPKSYWNFIQQGIAERQALRESRSSTAKSKGYISKGGTKDFRRTSSIQKTPKPKTRRKSKS